MISIAGLRDTANTIYGFLLAFIIERNAKVLSDVYY